MIATLLGLPESPLLTFLIISLGGLVAFFTFAGISYGYFFVWRRDRYHAGFVPNEIENRRAILWSIASVFGNAALMSPIHWLVAQDYSQIYWNVSDYGWGWLIASVVLTLFCTETMIYWIHRSIHTDFLFRTLHHTHHQWKASTPWVGLAFNPLDAFLQGLPLHLCVFVFPIHAGVFLISLGLVTVWAVMIHDRVSFVRWRFLNNTGHHTLHHYYSRYNYGQYFTFWDRLCGTHKSPFHDCEDVEEGFLAEA